MRRWAAYLVLLPVLGVALFLGARGDGRPATVGERTRSIAAGVRCPTCRGLSAADSDAPASLAIRREIRRRVEAGQSSGQIRAFLVTRYGKDILLKPEGSGLAGLVWALPVVFVVCAAGGLALAFRRWRGRPPTEVSPADRLLVERALSRLPGGGRSPGAPPPPGAVPR